MSNKKIAIVTGGAGFIGSHMVDLLLNQGFSVRVIDNLSSGSASNLAHHQSTSDLILDERSLLEIQQQDSLFKEATYVFHFAGIGDIVPSIQKPLDYMNINVQGTLKVLEAARESNIKKLVYAASSSCYGLTINSTNEQAPIDIQHPYALSKFMGEQACLHWNKVYHLPVNSMRIFNAYGTRSKTSGSYGAVIGVFLKQKIEHKPFTLVGDGQQKRDFIYVSDVANAFYQAAITPKSGEIYNLGAGNPQSILYLVKLLKGDVISIPKRPGEPECTWADITKICHNLNWKPTVSFEEGIATILENIDYWKEAPLWDPSSIEQSTKPWFKYLSTQDAP